MDKIKQAFIPAEQGTRDNDIAQRDDAQKEELAALRSQLANQSQLQQARAAHHQFERISLPGSQPASRVSAKFFLFSHFTSYSL